MRRRSRARRNSRTSPRRTPRLARTSRRTSRTRRSMSPVYPDVPAQQVGVSATKTVHTIFMKMFGIGSVKVSNDALAGFGVIPVDAYVTLDATGSMHDGNGTSSDPDCNAAETGGNGPGDVCPIKEAKDGAINFVNTLLSDNDTERTDARRTGRVPRLLRPAAEQHEVHRCDGSRLDDHKPHRRQADAAHRDREHLCDPRARAADGGSGTNVCQALKKGQDVLFGAGSHSASNTRRFLVMLSDGDNVYNADEVEPEQPAVAGVAVPSIEPEHQRRQHRLGLPQQHPDAGGQGRHAVADRRRRRSRTRASRSTSSHSASAAASLPTIRRSATRAPSA